MAGDFATIEIDLAFKKLMKKKIVNRKTLFYSIYKCICCFSKRNFIIYTPLYVNVTCTLRQIQKPCSYSLNVN